jgi:hypothetical protein
VAKAHAGSNVCGDGHYSTFRLVVTGQSAGAAHPCSRRDALLTAVPQQNWGLVTSLVRHDTVLSKLVTVDCKSDTVDRKLSRSDAFA